MCRMCLHNMGKLDTIVGRQNRNIVRENDLPRELGAPLFMNDNRRRTVQNVYGSVPFCVNNEVMR